MCAGFPQEKPGKQDAKRIATFAYHLLRRRKRLIKKIESGISSGSSAFFYHKKFNIQTSCTKSSCKHLPRSVQVFLV